MTDQLRIADRPTLDEPRPWQFPPVTRHQPDGGPDLRVVDLPGQALLTVKVLFDQPTTDEPLDLAGIGTVTGNALDEGAGDLDANELAAWKDRLGASFGTSVSSRGTTVSVSAPPAGIVGAVDLLSDVLTTPHLPAEEVDRLTRQRRDSISQQLARVPGRASEETRRRVFAAGDRNRVAGGGNRQTVARIDRDAVVAHHEGLVGSRATVIVAGDLSLVEGALVEHVQDRLAHLRGGTTSRVPAPSFVGRRQAVLVDRPGAVQTGIEVTRAGTDRHADDWAALRVATQVLGGTLTSRLDAVLREEKGFTYGSRSSLTSLRRGGWIRLVAGAFETPTTGEAMEDILRIIDTLRDDGPTTAEVTDAVRYLAGVQPLKFQRAGAIAGEVSRNLADGFDPTHTDVEHRQLTEVTPEAVAAAAATHLRTDDVTIVLVGDASQIAGPVAEALGEQPEIVQD